jgi:protease-4
MEFDQSTEHPQPPLGPISPGGKEPGVPSTQGDRSTYQPFERPRRRSGWSIFWGIIFGFSFLANVILFLLFVGIVGFVATGSGRLTQETIIRPGLRTHKIVVVNIEGTIDDKQAQVVLDHIETARQDQNVKAIIIRVNSPGGTISGSDRIYNEIVKYRQETGNPVLAFMQGLAASGGYYASVACDKIIAEPTTITGSIGVVMSYFVIEQLLENKLGVQPVFLTEGDKKDWPSLYRPPQQEELDYIRERLLTPAYERFVSVVQTGRSQRLSGAQVKQLADGSIFDATRALQEGLIDQIGYLDEAISLAESLASTTDARVVEYHKPFSFRNLLGVESSATLKLDRMSLYELCSPRALYLWNAY